MAEEQDIGQIDEESPRGRKSLANADADADVFKRFLVTKDRAKFAVGKSTKYLEIMRDGSVRLRDVKTSHLDAVISDPLQALQNVENAEDKILWEDKKKNKSRQFKFSTPEEKNEFFEELRKRIDSDKHKQKSKDESKYTVEVFKFVPNESKRFFISKATIRRRRERGDETKWNEYTGKVIAITNYRTVVIETYGQEMTQSQLQNGTEVIPALEVIHMCVLSMDCVQDIVTLHTKDLRTIQLDFSTFADSSLRQQFIKVVKQYVVPFDICDIFAFTDWFNLQPKHTPLSRTSDAADTHTQSQKYLNVQKKKKKKKHTHTKKKINK
ncbi:hypothetical protein RFI_27182 [Reticulomyxa filosa]|uniref:Uncharacterized protein n=1 Tax=Reticulomyxa filosa TaxID=46433 RepID=X6M965_RETFI|nr:hypothetical protein RFI_27182 [Reticulomyxa filosa]|eukprot:ETO10196.1 hypothetical protein RFI_27182 [Reticulomyxa filosa]